MSAVISLRNVTKSFGAQKALDGLSLEVPAGQIFGFLGPNGAGKTTTIRCLMDYIRPTSGSVGLLGKDARRDSAELKRNVGYLSSDMQLHPNWSVRTHIDFMAAIKGRGRADELVKQVNLDLDKKVHALSSGNKQKLAIILAFMGAPKLLIMDEPTRGLDPLLQNQLYALLKSFAKEGGTVFFSSHNLSEVQAVCTNVAVIKNGTIVADEAMSDILKMSIHNVQATFAKPLHKAMPKIANAEVLAATDTTLHLKVKGNLKPTLAALAALEITDLEITHATLEDIFLEYY